MAENAINSTGLRHIWDKILAKLSLKSTPIELTTAQYNALPSSDKNDASKVYYLTDYPSGGGSGGGSSSIKYSTDERVIGEWVDGKPIYEITYVPATTLHTNGSTWLNTGMAISDVDKLINYEVVAKDTNVNAPANIKGADFRYYNNNVQLYVIGQWYLDIQTITVRYTKTTDQA